MRFLCDCLLLYMGDIPLVSFNTMWSEGLLQLGDRELQRLEFGVNFDRANASTSGMLVPYV